LKLQKERGFLVLDFGSQLTQLIARRLRELNFYSEIHPYNISFQKIKDLNPYGIILSGGPSSVYEKGAPLRSVKELTESFPVLGICYGMQLLTKDLGGEVEAATHREYGFNKVQWSAPLGKVPKVQNVWMSHGDIVKKVPSGFEVVAMSESQHPAAIRGKNVWGVQFHPEVAHTESGIEILRSFAVDLCGAKPEWKSSHIVEHLQARVREQVGDQSHVLVGLSGGVDSSVVATLLTQTLGAERVHCVFVNNGLLRKNEYEEVLAQYKTVGLNVQGVDATQEFVAALKGLSDPEKKRKAIGRVFIEVFEQQLKPDVPIRFLGQGTLYPDVIESVSFHGGPSQTIKSHHNVGGLPDRMKLSLVEPLRELFKDEVRLLGKALGLPDEMLGRHPFPGPGLAIRIIGEVNENSLRISREADAIFISKLREHKLYHKIWQAFCVLLPVQTVGVQGDGRTYDQVLALRAVTSLDGMTADWYPFDFQFLREVSSEITNRVKGVSRVVYDITSKPPATIEWE
jgi:GMP synthase (glutamine-hydrolysing)